MRNGRVATRVLGMFVSALSALAGGCSSEPRHWQHPADWVAIHYEGDELSNQIVASPAITGRDSRGLLVVTVPMRSTTDRPVWVAASAVFYDRDGKPFGSRVELVPMAIEPYGASRLTFNSPTSRADDFQLYLRAGK